jgi:hypothetical protein
VPSFESAQVASTSAHSPAVLTIGARIAEAKREVERNGVALTAAEEACLKGVESTRDYAAASFEREKASTRARLAAQGISGSLVTASRELADATQKLSDLKRAALDANPAVSAARKKIQIDEDRLIALLREQGTTEIVIAPEAVTSPRTPSASYPPPLPTGVDYARVSSSGYKDVYVRSYYRKDGTYVHSHMRSSPRR